MVMLYGNESLRYKKQSMATLNRLSAELGKEIENINSLVYSYHNIEGKENIESKFNNVLMDISNVNVLLEVSRYGKGLSKEEKNTLFELLNFHEYLSEELLYISYQYSKTGQISEEQLSDLDTLKAMFYQIKSEENDSNNSYSIWYGVIMSYSDDFSDTGLISEYYR